MKKSQFDEKRWITGIDEVVLMLQKIREQSVWGQKQDLSTMLRYLMSEVDELAESIQHGDRINMAEEIGDVLMVSIFTSIVVEDSYGIPFENILLKTCTKLRRRYPDLFLNRSDQITYLLDTLDKRLEYEEMVWGREKKNQALLEFCFCANSNCQAYSRPGADSLELITEGEIHFVTCTLCNNVFPLSVSLLFPDCQTDRNKVLLDIVHYLQGVDMAQVAASQEIPTYALQQCLLIPPHQKIAIKRLIFDKYGIEKIEIFDHN